MTEFFFLFFFWGELCLLFCIILRHLDICILTGRANHWSALIGASHSKNYILWEYGGYASDGVKQVAELGSPVKMEEEIRQKVRVQSNLLCFRIVQYILKE